MIKLPVSLMLLLIFSSTSLSEQPTRKVCFEKACVQAEVADTESKRQLGLMFREGLPEKQGMLFVFEREDKHSFWMKNMRLSLDIIWINKDKRIVDISLNVPPCKDSCKGFIPKEKAKYVLEVSAGFTEKNRVKIGDGVDF